MKSKIIPKWQAEYMTITLSCYRKAAFAGDKTTADYLAGKLINELNYIFYEDICRYACYDEEEAADFRTEIDNIYCD